jgi:antitoxin (DNA-binding transcriptional repressor) of toxin-antitoxin stability system
MIRSSFGRLIMTVSVEQAQTSLKELIERTSRGETVVITQDQKPVAELRSAAIPRPVPALDDLFAEWASEDPTNDPSEINRRNQEVLEFKEAMNRNRIEMEGTGSRKPFP